MSMIKPLVTACTGCHSGVQVPNLLSFNALGAAYKTKPGANNILIDPLHRVTESPALPFQLPAVAEWDWDTRGLAPGAYLVICTFKPHLDTGMTGTVVIQ